MDWSKFNQAEKIAKSLRVNPRLSVSSVAAALVAPVFISNDDRGYVQSSLITSPLIAAAAIAGPSIGQVFKRENLKAKQFFKDAPARVMSKGPKSYAEIRDMEREFAAGGMRHKTFNQELGKFYAGTPKGSNFNELASQVRAGLYDAPVGTDLAARARYYENIVHAESLKSLSSNELIGYVGKYKRTSVAPSIGMDGVRSMIEQQIANRNEPFIKAINFHMQKSKSMIYSGYKGVPEDPFDLPGIIPSRNKSIGWNGSSSLQSQRPDLFSSLQSQIDRGNINPKDISIITSNKASNPILGLKIGELNIPVVGNNGRIIGGADWDKTGVSRGVFVGRKKYLSDVYAVEHIGFGADAIQKELSAINIIGGVDNLDDWSNGSTNVAAASDIEAGIISRKYVGSNLTGFGADGTKGFDQQTAYETEEFVGQLDKVGLMKSGSEKMTRVFEDIEMSRASYLGLQDASRQNAYTRGLGKNVYLGNITDRAKKPYMISDFFEELNKGDRAAVVGTTQGGVTAAQRTFFSQLPEDVKDIHTYEKQAIEQLMSRHSLNETQARGAWKRLSTLLSDPKNLAVARKSSALGEGSKLAVRNLNGMNISRTRNFTLNEGDLGADPTSLIGTKITKNQILGFNLGNPITTDGNAIFTGFEVLENGEMNVSVTETERFGKGSKIDAFTRGLVGEDMTKSQAKDILNYLVHIIN